MKNISATIIGSTKIAEAHIYSLNKLGIKIVDIATRLDSKNVEKLKIFYEINQKEILDWKSSINKYQSDLIIIANKSDLHKKITDYSLSLEKYVLCEKPGWEKDSSEIIKNNKLRFAYNRRFYSWVNGLRKSLENSKNKIILEVNLVEFNSEFLKFYEIVSHYIDLSTYILGKKFSLTESKFYKGENFFQISNPKFLISYKVWNNISSNYSIFIQDGETGFKVSPIENFSKFNGFIVKNLTPFDKEYNPKVVSNIIENDKEEKFGFYHMYKDVIKWYEGLNNNLCTIEEENVNRIIGKELFEVSKFS